MKGTHIGEFEELVLLVVCVLHGQAYGVAIQEEMKRQTGRGASISAVHAALNRLQKKGFVESWVGGATKERGGRRKRFFQATAAGRDALRTARQMRDHLWNLIPDMNTP